MNFESRSYNSHLIRPRPLVFTDTSENFILIMTAWGSAEVLPSLMDHVKQFLQTVRQDAELTTPFQNILTLSDEANDLRVASLMANDFVFRSLNQDKYQVVVETCFLTIKKGHVAWSHMGSPHLILKKKDQRPQPVSCHPESHSDLNGFPLPVQFLGAEPTISPRSGDLYLDKGDELILLASSTLPAEVWTLKEEASLANWTEALAKSDESQPFWLGRIQIG